MDPSRFTAKYYNPSQEDFRYCQFSGSGHQGSTKAARQISPSRTQDQYLSDQQELDLSTSRYLLSFPQEAFAVEVRELYAQASALPFSPAPDYPVLDWEQDFDDVSHSYFAGYIQNVSTKIPSNYQIAASTMDGGPLCRGGVGAEKDALGSTSFPTNNQSRQPGAEAQNSAQHSLTGPDYVGPQPGCSSIDSGKGYLRQTQQVQRNNYSQPNPVQWSQSTPTVPSSQGYSEGEGSWNNATLGGAERTQSGSQYESYPYSNQGHLGSTATNVRDSRAFSSTCSYRKASPGPSGTWPKRGVDLSEHLVTNGAGPAQPKASCESHIL